MKSRERIFKKLLSKRSTADYEFDEDQFARTLESDAIESENSSDIELMIGKSGQLSVAIIESGDEQYLIRIYLIKPDQPKMTILYDQCQFSNLDRTVHKLCKAGIYLYG